MSEQGEDGFIRFPIGLLNERPAHLRAYLLLARLARGEGRLVIDIRRFAQTFSASVSPGTVGGYLRELSRRNYIGIEWRDRDQWFITLPTNDLGEEWNVANRPFEDVP